MIKKRVQSPITVKAQHRLQKKFWKVRSRKHACAAVTAVAREFFGFLWAALWVLEDKKS